jgi:hypothetical protein
MFSTCPTGLTTVKVERLPFLMMLTTRRPGGGSRSAPSLYGPKELQLTRRGVAVELAADRLLLPAETRRVLLQQFALGAHQTGGVILPHLLL